MNRVALYHLESLLWIARLGTFHAAADRLNITQPTISARMRELEGQLGYPLFQREGRRMLLTPRARQLVQDCEPIWAQLERAFDKGQRSGSVRIGTGEIAAATCLPDFLASLERDWPGVTLDVSIELTAHLIEHLLSAASDLVFLAGPVAAPGLKVASIGTVRLVWLGHPETARRIAQDGWEPPVWSLPRHSPLYGLMLEMLAERKIDPAVIHRCNNVRALIETVAAGQGVALLPALMAAEAMARGDLVEVWPAPKGSILFQAAMRAGESDPLILDLFERARSLHIAESA
jgi:DNA-binding transcriptional LysR family regulator